MSAVCTSGHGPWLRLRRTQRWWHLRGAPWSVALGLLFPCGSMRLRRGGCLVSGLLHVYVLVANPFLPCPLSSVYVYVRLSVPWSTSLQRCRTGQWRHCMQQAGVKSVGWPAPFHVRWGGWLHIRRSGTTVCTTPMCVRVAAWCPPSSTHVTGGVTRGSPGCHLHHCLPCLVPGSTPEGTTAQHGCSSLSGRQCNHQRGGWWACLLLNAAPSSQAQTQGFVRQGLCSACHCEAGGGYSLLVTAHTRVTPLGSLHNAGPKPWGGHRRCCCGVSGAVCRHIFVVIVTFGQPCRGPGCGRGSRVHPSPPVLLRLLQLVVPGCVLWCELPYKQHMAGGCATRGGPPPLR